MPSAQDQTQPRARGAKGRRPRNVTLRDVARACGLSVYPVSRVLSGKYASTPETAARIRRVAAELGYKQAQNDLARRLSLRKSGEAPLNHVIGLLMPNHIEKVNFFFNLFRGISETISSAGYGLLIIPTYDPVVHQELPVQLPPSVVRGEVDGLIVQSGLEFEVLRHLREETGFAERPIVAVNGILPSAYVVQRDERQGAKLAMAHLLDLGHRRILCFSKGWVNFPGSDRLEGYREACERAGVELADCLIPVSIDYDHLAEVPLLAAAAKHPEATALLTHNDPIALMACYALQSLGKRIPADISVVGWDDTDPFLDPQGNNQLTCVGFDLVDMGRRAARILVDRIEGRPVADPPLVMPPTLHVRGTTAPPGRKSSLDPEA